MYFFIEVGFSLSEEIEMYLRQTVYQGLSVLGLLLFLVSSISAQDFNWTRENTTNCPTKGRYTMSCAYDCVEKKIVMFGGDYTNWIYSDELWEWDGIAKHWTSYTPAVKPNKRHFHGMAYDKKHGITIICGGVDNSSGVNYLNDIWAWDGGTKSWTDLTPTTGPFPSNREGFQMVYDDTLDKILLFGGCTNTGGGAYNWSNETWLWDGATNTWTQHFPSTIPDPRGAFAMTYDSNRGVAVLFGGNNNNGWRNDTWEWDSNTMDWYKCSPANQPAQLVNHAMAYNKIIGKVVLFGGGTSGSNAQNKTWTWDGVNWVEIFPDYAPPAIHSHCMAYDEATNRITYHGGITSGSPKNHTFTLALEEIS